MGEDCVASSRHGCGCDVLIVSVNSVDGDRFEARLKVEGFGKGGRHRCDRLGTEPVPADVGVVSEDVAFELVEDLPAPAQLKRVEAGES